MKQFLKHVRFLAFLTSYFTAGVLGHAEEWTKLVEVYSQHKVSQNTQHSFPSDSQPRWIEQKHVPAAVRVSLSAPDLPSTGSRVDERQVLTHVSPPDIRAKTQNVVFRRSSRAPPTE